MSSSGVSSDADQGSCLQSSHIRSRCFKLCFISLISVQHVVVSGYSTKNEASGCCIVDMHRVRATRYDSFFFY